MLRRFIAAVTVVCLAAALPGCYARFETGPDALVEYPEYRIESLVTVDGQVIHFETGHRRALVHGEDVVGYTAAGEPVRVPLSEVQAAYVAEFQEGQTTATVVTLSALALTVLVLAWQSAVDSAYDDGYSKGFSDAGGSSSGSCPFLYSYDGARYVFDAEPYGSAICAGLEHSEVCELEHLRAVDGEYRVRLTNALEETQFTNELALLVVDHPTDVSVVPDEAGALYAVGAPEAPLLARDQHGRDWLRWLSENDLLFWQSDLSSKDPARESDLRDTLYLAFPMPRNTSDVKLVMSGRNTDLSSRVLREGTALRGDRLEEWYSALSVPAVRERYQRFFVREEVGVLQVRVWVDDRWEQRAVFDGCAPMVFEDRIVPLDLTGVPGDTLRIMLAPPAGFWELNRVGLDCTPDVPIDVVEIAAASAVSDDGRDLRPALASADGSYYVMEEVRRTASITFPVPPETEGLDRTVFARVSGYYEMHIDAEGPEETALLERIEFEPGYVVRYALERHGEWREAMLAWAAVRSQAAD
jgi:hypothetical protein